MSNQMEQTISVAICTYNGEKYIAEQLDSIIKQTLPPKEIIVCDDASEDRTIEIIDDISKNTAIPIKIFINSKRLGVIKNFEKSISVSTGNYVALSDQDDVWLPNKLEISVKKIKEVETEYGDNSPILVHSDLCVVDEKCTIISPSFMRSQNLFHVYTNPIATLMVQNFVTGCTILINKSLIKVALPIPSGVIMHDWWLALIAASCGQLVFISQPTIYYRQHLSNVVGAKQYFSLGTAKRLLNLKNLNQSIAKAIEQTDLLKKHSCAQASIKASYFIDNHLNNITQKNVISVIKTITLGVTKQGYLRNIIFYCLLLSGSYKKYLFKKYKEENSS